MKKELVEKINKYLANLCVEYIKLHNLHWNVVGSNFKAIHEYLESLYDGISSSFDKVAELLKMKDETPIACIKDYLSLKTIEEITSKDYNTLEVFNIVLNDFNILKDQACNIRESAENECHYNIISAFEDELEYLNKAIWFIKSSLK